jgi:hypothetical protein
MLASMNGIDTPSGRPPGGVSGWRGFRPPVDRAAGRRGVRALMVYVAVLAAVVVLSLSGFNPDPGWTDPAMKGAAAAMIVGAGLLWFARRPLGVAVGVALLAAGLATSVQAIEARRDSDESKEKWAGSVVTFSDRGRTAPLTAAEMANVPEHATRAEVTGLLGRPTGLGLQRVNGEPDLRCIAYPKDRFDPSRGGHLHAFCFSHGRLAAQRDW